MPFWNARRSASADRADGSAAHDLAPRLEPIEVFTADAQTAGWMIALEERILDFLGAHAVLRVCTDPAADRWESFARSELLMVSPPPLPQPNPRRIHRQKRRVRVLIGPYVVTGVMHVPPGASPEAFVQSARPEFIALTDAVVAEARAPDSGLLFDVVIVNAPLVSELTTLVAIATAPPA